MAVIDMVEEQFVIFLINLMLKYTLSLTFTIYICARFIICILYINIYCILCSHLVLIFSIFSL